jgi:hypothetical protein
VVHRTSAVGHMVLAPMTKAVEARVFFEALQAKISPHSQRNLSKIERALNQERAKRVQLQIAVADAQREINRPRVEQRSRQLKALKGRAQFQAQTYSTGTG